MNNWGLITLSKKYRYTVGTGDSAKKDIASNDIPVKEKQGNFLMMLEHVYKGKLDNEWQ